MVGGCGRDGHCGEEGGRKLLRCQRSEVRGAEACVCGCTMRVITLLPLLQRPSLCCAQHQQRSITSGSTCIQAEQQRRQQARAAARGSLFSARVPLRRPRTALSARRPGERMALPKRIIKVGGQPARREGKGAVGRGANRRRIAWGTTRPFADCGDVAHCFFLPTGDGAACGRSGAWHRRHPTRGQSPLL